MSETKGYAPFWVEFLIYLVPVPLVLTLMIYIFTKELLIVYLGFAIMAAFLIGLMWITHREYESRIGRKGFLGYLLCFFSWFMDEWIWIRLCLVLLGSGLMLYDVISKRALSQAQNGEIENE